MTHKDLNGQYESMAPAFLSPTLQLLKRRNAREFMAIIRTVFPVTSCGLPKRELVSVLDGLAGARVLCEGRDGASPCEPLTGTEWFRRLVDGDPAWVEGRRDRRRGVTMLYHPTSAALAAMDVVDQLSSATIPLSGTRVSAVISLLGDARMLMSGDFSTALEVYRARAEEAQARYERLKERGSVDDVPYEVAEQKMAELLDQWRGIPTALAEIADRVAERGDRMQSEFLSEGRPAGEVGREALDDMNRISGRWKGETNDALSILIEPSTSDSMRRAIDDLSRLLRQREGDDRWTHAMRRAWEDTFEGVARVIRELDHQARVVGRATTRLNSSGAREHLERMARLERAAVGWARRTDKRGLLDEPEGIRLCAPRLEQVMPPTEAAPPPSVVAPTFDVPTGPDALPRSSMPHTREVIASMRELDGPTAAARFNRLPADRRRVVEVLGLIAHAIESGLPPEGTGSWEVLYRDGSTAVLEVPDWPAASLLGEGRHDDAR